MRFVTYALICSIFVNSSLSYKFIQKYYVTNKAKRHIDQYNHYFYMEYGINKYYVDLKYHNEILSLDFKVVIDNNYESYKPEIYIGNIENNTFLMTRYNDEIYAYIKELNIYIEPAYHIFNSIHNNSVLIAFDANEFGLTTTAENCYLMHLNNLETAKYMSCYNKGIKNKARKKRAITQNLIDSNVSKRCSLLLVADWRFFQAVGKSSIQNTINYLVGVISRINAIYTTTVWETPDGQNLTNFGFIIRQILIHTHPTINSNNLPLSNNSFRFYNGPTHEFDEVIESDIFSLEHYNGPSPKWTSVGKFLESFTLYRPKIIGKYKNEDAKVEEDDICLAHLFTHQPFEGNVLGLAYVASDKMHRPGGVCTYPYNYPIMRKTYGSRFLSHVPISLNTGFSSYQNEALRTVFTQEGDIITAHELGHNWGSEHDLSTKTWLKKRTNINQAPSFDDTNRYGSYIMHPYSLRGFETNNQRFSPSSRLAIGSVLRAKSHLCFTQNDLNHEPDNKEDMCGNGILDKNEQCDPGFSSDTNFYNSAPSGIFKCCTQECKYAKEAMCDDTISECCVNCKPATIHQNKTCLPQIFSALVGIKDKSMDFTPYSLDFDCFTASPIPCNGKNVNCPIIYLYFVSLNQTISSRPNTNSITVEKVMPHSLYIDYNPNQNLVDVLKKSGFEKQYVGKYSLSLTKGLLYAQAFYNKSQSFVYDVGSPLTFFNTFFNFENQTSLCKTFSARGMCDGSGKCISHCESHGLTPCICREIDKSCYLCCKPIKSTKTTECQPFIQSESSQTQYIVLDEGEPCNYGYCSKKGKCEVELTDKIQRIWQYVENININDFKKLMADNLVGTIIVLTTFIWIPASLYINFLDKKRDEQLRKFGEWMAEQRKKQNQHILPKLYAH